MFFLKKRNKNDLAPEHPCDVRGLFYFRKILPAVCSIEGCSFFNKKAGGIAAKTTFGRQTKTAFLKFHEK